MWHRFKKRIVSRWLRESDTMIIKKDNGFQNIQIIHRSGTVLVIHPLEEKGIPGAEGGFFPYMGYVKI